MTSTTGFKQGRQTALIVTTTAGLEGAARRELTRLLPDLEARSLPLRGNLLVLTEVPEEEAIACITAGDTECVAQVIPVQRAAPVGSAEGTFPEVAAAAAEIGRLAPGSTFVVRARRRGTHEWSTRELERGVALALEKLTGAVGEYEKDSQWHVSVQVYQDRAYVGVNPPAHMVAREPRRKRKYAPGERPLNRAQWKIQEALATFQIELSPGAEVLDLGSAPGGWVSVLCERAGRVVAVDPADLDPKVASRANVEHFRCRAETLASRDDLQGRFHLLTCDMNLDPADSARIVCLLAPLLRAGAPAIMTVKYVSPHRRRHEREARAILAEQYEEIRMKRLPHNAKETTAAMHRKGAGGAAPK